MDGHNSHYTVAFLLYAREHYIIVLCYIPHSTHVYQGLDVVIFSPLKKFIGEERDKWLRENGAAMDKNSFLVVYGRAHVRALTPENIKAAFKKTGIWPFNPHVVTTDMLAPSTETSCEAHVPVPPEDPAINVLATMFRKLAKLNDTEEVPDVISDGPIAGPSMTKHNVINEAVEGLSQTKLAHLISTTLTTSHDTMPTTITQTIFHPKPSPLLAIEPKTETEILLLAALQEYQKTNEDLTNRNIALQAGNLLNEVYCGNAKGALQFREEKKGKKGQRTLLEGLPCLLTGDNFYEQRVNLEKGRRADEREKESRKDAKEAWKVAKEEWQRAENKRKACKEREAAKYEKALAAWKAANVKTGRGRGRGRGHGRGGGGATGTKKPVMAAIPKRVPPPLLKDFLAGRSVQVPGEEEDGEEDDEEDEEEPSESGGSGSDNSNDDDDSE